MYPFDSKRGRLAVGIAAASGGGSILTHMMSKAEDPQRYQLLQAILVFWLIFVAKTTLGFMRQLSDSEAAPAGRQQRRTAAAVAAAAAGIDDDDDGESTGTPEPSVRRRRTRRD